MSADTIRWQDAYDLQFEPMDHTHREFIELVAALQQAAHRPEGAACLDTLVEHCVAHFELEDRWLAELGVDTDNCHSAQHAQVLGAMRTIQSHMAAAPEHDYGEVLQTLAAGLAEWFDGHARMADAALAQILRDQAVGIGRGLPARSIAT